MIETNNFKKVEVSSQLELREWLKNHHQQKESVWLVTYKKRVPDKHVTMNQKLDELLCFGWIDSKRKPVDEEKFMQFFSRRKSRGTWSKVNKEKVGQLIAEGLMTKAGLTSIETAKQNGSWTILNDV